MSIDRNRKKVTLVSTLPFTLREEKPGMFPAYYEVAAAPTKGTLGITHIGDAYYHDMVPFSDNRTPPRRIDISADRVAESLINDYISACLAVQHDLLDNGSQRIPGLFWIDGVYNGSQVQQMERERISIATANTTSWFEALVKLADDDWQKNHQHKMITDLQRHACKYLGFTNREWSVDVVALMNNVCPACKASVNAEAFVCATCRFILDKVKYAANKENFATV